MDYIKKYFVWNTNPALYGLLNRLLLITDSNGCHLMDYIKKNILYGIQIQHYMVY